jgi:hypothetical protein
MKPKKGFGGEKGIDKLIIKLYMWKMKNSLDNNEDEK